MIYNNEKPAILMFQDGRYFRGIGFGKPKIVTGELVFNTMTGAGYNETLTDPSYQGQIVTMTHPLVGNYGVPAWEKDEFGIFKYFESDSIKVSGFIVNECCKHPSHYESIKTLDAFLFEQDIPGIEWIDTRAVTKVLREEGVQVGLLAVYNAGEKPNIDELKEIVKKAEDPNLRHLASEVSIKEVITLKPINPVGKVVLLDMGVKLNILRNLVQRGLEVIVVPYNYTYDQIISYDPDGVFISNGPGDPAICKSAIEVCSKLIENSIPTMGICLGNQILALGAGASSYKLKYGHRGGNKTVINPQSQKCYITSQNHGFCVKDFEEGGFEEILTNIDDKSNEGIEHKTKPIFAVQFHPEACPGPLDSLYLFDKFRRKYEVEFLMPLDTTIKKALVLGSGGIRIGQAGEFDYSGSQVLKALKEEGIETILINPNIATIQTDPQLSDKVYLLPINVDYVEEVIKKERPDSILLAFGGQTALNVGVELKELGILDKYNIRVAGTPIEAIEVTEDRDLFVKAMDESGVKVCKSKAVSSYTDAIKAAEEIGFPCMLRVAYTLGGRGSGICSNMREFEKMAKKGLAQSRINQILIEESIWGWKEIEYEVVRDAEDNCFINCNMENFDPVGIHTGESIVVAPSQTLTNEEYQMLRSASIRVIRNLGIIGECNIQYGLDPFSKEFRAIEVNARLSRSSALASKATGYPLAYIAAKLAVGYTLPELKNKITGITTACFEPALDYLVLKIPRWDLTKFQRVDRKIGSQMKSVGEVMAIGRTFEEIIQKALRMLDIGMKGLVGNKIEVCSDINELKYALSNPTDLRVFRIVEAINSGISIDEIYELSRVDKWFLYKIKNIIDVEKGLENLDFLSSSDDDKLYWFERAKRFGFSDGQIAKIMGLDVIKIRQILKRKYQIQPYVKRIDTLAAEWPAKTNYLYMTYAASEHDIDFEKENEQNLRKVIVLGSGTYRIGASVEFDWCSVNCLWGLKKLGVDQAIMINYNPETVSTDYDTSDKLYFEELSGERVLDIIELEKADGVVVSVGGQIAQNLAAKFSKYSESFRKVNLNILGTHGSRIDMAEDRSKFSSLLDQLEILQPQWSMLTDKEGALKFAQEVGYPVLVRPSYVLSGAAMRVSYDEKTLKDTLDLAAAVSQEYPVVITKFFTGAREVEADGISDGTKVFIGAVVEHIENAGVHSGDATMSIPPQTVSEKVIEKIENNTREIALALKIRGPFNVQYLVKDEEVYVIECNLRSSRSMPYVSKTRGINLMRLAAEVFMGAEIPQRLMDLPYGKYVVIKAPMFSFMRLDKADPVLGVEMASTGEVACVGEDFADALIKSLEAADMNIPIQGGNVLISVGGEELKKRVIPLAKKLKDMGFTIFATEDTAIALKENGIYAVKLYKIHEYGSEPNIMGCLQNGAIDLVINIPLPTTVEDRFRTIMEDEYKIRRMAVDYNLPVIINLELAEALIDAIQRVRRKEKSIKSLNEYHETLKEVYW